MSQRRGDLSQPPLLAAGAPQAGKGALVRAAVAAEGLIALVLIALAAFADLARPGAAEFGFKQTLCAVVGVLGLIDASVRARHRSALGLLSHLHERTRGGRAAFLTLAAGLLAITLAAFLGYRVDDAWITFRYAQNLVATGAVVWNPGEAPIEGYSNFLWMLLAAATLALGGEPLVVSRAVSVAALLVSAWLVRRLAVRTGASLGAARLSALALLAIPAFAFWAMSGLETVSVVALSLGLLETIAMDAERPRWPWRSALIAAALVLSRPEAPLFLALVLLPMLIGAEPGARRTALRLAALTVLLAAPYLAWKWAAFGSLVPNSAVAKAGALRGLPIVTQAYLFAFPFLLLAVARAARGSTRLELQIWLAAAGYGLAGIHVATQVAHQLRFFLPVLAGMCVVIGPALEWLATEGVPPARRRLAFAGLAAAFLAFALAPVFEARAYARHEMAGLARAHASIGRVLWETYRGEGLLAASDCGIIPALSRMRTIDLWGLNDAVIARHGLDPARVMAARPEVVILHSVGDDRFRARESYDLAMHTAVLREPRLVLRGSWEFSGYRLWVWSERPLLLGVPPPAAFSPPEQPAVASAIQ